MNSEHSELNFVQLLFDAKFLANEVLQVARSPEAERLAKRILEIGTSEQADRLVRAAKHAKRKFKKSS
jgi:hypothetical protein